jgi:hypothetical protein
MKALTGQGQKPPEEFERQDKLDRNLGVRLEQIIAEVLQSLRTMQVRDEAHVVELVKITRTRIRAMLRPEQQSVYDDRVRGHDSDRERKFKGAA